MQGMGSGYIMEEFMKSYVPAMSQLPCKKKKMALNSLSYLSSSDWHSMLTFGSKIT